jgi:hypothetical protein
MITRPSKAALPPTTRDISTEEWVQVAMSISTKRPPPIRHPQYGSDLKPVSNPESLEKPWANYYRDLSSGDIGVPNFADAEAPVGVIDGVNAVFTLANAPTPANSLQLFRNGQKLVAGVGYALAGKTITMQSSQIPTAGDTLEATYRY